MAWVWSGGLVIAFSFNFLFFNSLFLISLVADTELEQNLPLFPLRNGKYLTDSGQKRSIEPIVFAKCLLLFSPPLIYYAER